MREQNELRKQLLDLLRGGHAHLSFQDALAEFPAELRDKKPPFCPWSGWDLLEHLRLTQWDILEFIRNPDYVSPPWPQGYWPHGKMPADPEAWEQQAAAFVADRQALEAMVADPAINLTTPIPHGQGQTILREVLLVVDHSAYHLGQMVLLRRLLGAWPEDV